MTCSWTPKRQYTDYVELQARGDGGVLSYMYRPVIKGIKLVGDDIYVRSLRPEDFTLHAPSCSAFLEGEACNIQIALTKYQYVHKFCLTDCDWDEVVTDVGMEEVAKAEATAQLTTLLPLLYADMIANGSHFHILSATPTGAQMLAAINNAILQINAYGGYPGAILLDFTYAGATLTAMGGLFQPLDTLKIDLYGPGSPIGTYLGYPLFVTLTNLATADATPIGVGFLVWAKNGVCYGGSGDAGGYLGLKIVPHENDEQGTNSIISKLCAGYKTLEPHWVVYGTLET